jgi:hypothetical protein
MKVSGQLHAPAALPPEKEPRYSLDRRLGGPHSRFKLKLHIGFHWTRFCLNSVPFTSCPLSITFISLLFSISPAFHMTVFKRFPRQNSVCIYFRPTSSYIWRSSQALKFQYPSRYSDWLRAGRQRGRTSSPGMVKNCLFSTSSSSALRPTQPPSQWVLGALSPGVKRPGSEADHSPQTSAKVKKMWIYISTSQYAFMA